ncbi:MAG: DNA primase, partial [Verrucomicrobia bacterium]|nr:DNA primase [Cytophagales bacterium]
SDEEIERQNERDSLYIALNFAKNYFQTQLFESEEGISIGLSYFKERSLNDKTIRDFELGFSHVAYDAFTKHALKNGFSIEILEKAGLTLRKENENGTFSNPYDRFRERVIFPIHNVSGRVIAFGARILNNDKNQAKYINSPETEVYHKSFVLYGIFQAKNAIRQQDLCYLTEGYMDVISLHQAGIQHVVASSGTSLTVEQIRLIGRFTKNVILLYDGDAAGIKAALRGLDLILEEGLQVRIVVFPDNEDADSYVKKVGSQAFTEFINRHSKDLIAFKTSVLLKDAQNDPFKKANVIVEIVQSITKIPDPIARAVFFKETATQLQISEETLLSESNKILIKLRQQKEKDFQRQQKNNTQNSDNEPFTENIEYQVVENENLEKPDIGERKQAVVYQEEECMRLLLNYTEAEIEDVQLVDFLLEQLSNTAFSSPVYKEMLQIFQKERALGRAVDNGLFIHHQNPEIRLEAIKLTSQRYELSENWKKVYDIDVPHEIERLSEVVNSNLSRLRQRMIQQLMTEVLNKLKAAESMEEQDKLMKMYKHLKDNEKQIATELGNVIR